MKTRDLRETRAKGSLKSPRNLSHFEVHASEKWLITYYEQMDYMMCWCVHPTQALVSAAIITRHKPGSGSTRRNMPARPAMVFADIHASRCHESLSLRLFW